MKKNETILRELNEHKSELERLANDYSKRSKKEVGELRAYHCGYADALLLAAELLEINFDDRM